MPNCATCDEKHPRVQRVCVDGCPRRVGGWNSRGYAACRLHSQLEAASTPLNAVKLLSRLGGFVFHARVVAGDIRNEIVKSEPESCVTVADTFDPRGVKISHNRWRAGNLV